MPDGEIVRRSGMGKFATLENIHGKFEIFAKAKVAVKSSPDMEGTPYPEFPDLMTFEIAEKTFDGRECYEITAKVIRSPEVAEAVDTRQRKLEKSGTKNLKPHERLEHWFSATRVYLIGKDDLFIYRESRYSCSGKQVSDNILSNVILDPDQPDELFIIPDDYRIELPSTLLEYSNSCADAIEEMRGLKGNNLSDEHENRPIKLKWIIVWLPGACCIILASLVVIRYGRRKIAQH